ncbi:MAG TPA: energy transducer TonB [Bacteroidaceae bacterium]|jgi:protein TonB|nr:energy transducer TonB [Bacteroidales bacterium]HPX98355.1 energy transducer TonB [Bacteroidaceae bacterium]
MEVKKSKHADLERSKSTFLLMGFVFAFAVIFVALEWTQSAEKEDNSDIYGVRDLTFIDEEMIPITLPEKKTVQPPPQSTSKAEIIEIIEDDADVVEDILISTEDQTTFVDISAMDVVYVEPEPEEEEIFMVVEDQPEFPGGTAALLEYLRKNIKYPAICRENNIQGRVLIQFIVNRDGTVVDPEVVRSVDPNLDREALRVISTMPKWKPGLQRGKPVRVKFTVPVNFKLN